MTQCVTLKDPAKVVTELADLMKIREKYIEILANYPWFPQEIIVKVEKEYNDLM